MDLDVDRLLVVERPAQLSLEVRPGSPGEHVPDRPPDEPDGSAADHPGGHLVDEHEGPVAVQHADTVAQVVEQGGVDEARARRRTGAATPLPVAVHETYLRS